MAAQSVLFVWLEIDIWLKLIKVSHDTSHFGRIKLNKYMVIWSWERDSSEPYRRWHGAIWSWESYRRWHGAVPHMFLMTPAPEVLSSTYCLGVYAGEDWLMCFTALPHHQGCKDLMVFIHTRYTETFLMCTVKVSEEVKALLQEVSPHFGFPRGPQNVNDPHFTSQALNAVAKILNGH